MSVIAHLHALRSMAQELKAVGILTSLRRLGGNLNPRRSPRVFFFSHPLDETGAPQALLVAIKEFANHLDPKSIHVVFPSATKAALRRFEETGAILHRVPRQASALGLHLRLGIQEQDLVVVNTLAVPLEYVSYLEARTHESLIHAWVHEGEAMYLNGSVAERLKTLVGVKRLVLHAPGVDAASVVEARFQSPVSVAYPFAAEEIPRRDRQASDYHNLRIAFVGGYAGGLKGQLLALVGLAQAVQGVHRHEQRDFTVTLYGVKPDRAGVYDVAALRLLCEHFFPGRFSIVPPGDRSDFLARYCESNVTVCSSFSEAFPLFVLEGMKNSNALVRNLCAGASEQIVDNLNGFAVQQHTVEAYRDAFKKLLSTSLTTSEALARMGNASRDLADAIPTSDLWVALGGEAHFGRTSLGVWTDDGASHGEARRVGSRT